MIFNQKWIYFLLRYLILFFAKLIIMINYLGKSVKNMFNQINRCYFGRKGLIKGIETTLKQKLPGKGKIIQDLPVITKCGMSDATAIITKSSQRSKENTAFQAVRPYFATKITTHDKLSNINFNQIDSVVTSKD